MWYRFLFVLLMCAVFSSCKEEQTVEIALYNWDSGVDEYSFRKFREKNHFNILYVRLFDIKWHSDYGAYPEAHTYSDLHFDSSLEIIPVVYLTNEALLLTPLDSMAYLTKKISKEMDYQWHYTFGQNNYQMQEVQFDCDWTSKSKEKYFLFLESMKKLRKEKISCTVKLYQYAYREKAGIPPVDRAVLMCYNLQDLRKLTIPNSIFDVEEAKKYLSKADYPIPLDFALPEFGWTLMYRNGKFKGINRSINKMDIEMLPVKQIDSIRYEFTSNFESYWHEVDYMKGDILKFEKASGNDYLRIKEELKRHYNQKHTRIILFDLSHLENSDHAEDSTYFIDLDREFSF